MNIFVGEHSEVFINLDNIAAALCYDTDGRPSSGPPHKIDVYLRDGTFITLKHGSARMFGERMRKLAEQE